MNQIMLYGISGAERAYTVLGWFCIYDEYATIQTIRREASILKMYNPSIEHVYAIDNRRGLKREYMESMKKNSIESHAIFKDTLEREGLKVY